MAEPQRSEESVSEVFYVRALKDDLRVFSDGKYYNIRTGFALRVNRNGDNLTSFGADIKNGFFELISESTYNLLVKRGKIAREDDYRESPIDDLENMIDNISKKNGS